MVIPDSYNFNDYNNNQIEEDLLGVCVICKEELDYDYETILCFKFGEYHAECYKKWYSESSHDC